MLNSSTVRWCSHIVIVLCYSAISIACLALIGWHWNIGSLRSIVSTYEPMTVSTAFLIIFCSISLILLRYEQINRLGYRIGKALALCVLIVSIFLIFNPYTPIQQNYFSSPFSTCFNFILFSICILFIDNHFFNNKKIISFIVSTILLSSLLSLLGYIFVKNPNYQIVILTRMSVLTSVSFFILCIAILLTRPYKGIAYIFLEKTIDATFLRRVPLFFVITIILAYVANYGQNYDWYDDGFSDLLTTMSSIIILIFLLVMTATKLRVQEKRILAQQEIAKIIESGKEFKDVSSDIIQVLCSRLDWDVGEILLLNKKETMLKYFSIWHIESIPPELILQLKNLPFAKGLGIPGKAWENGKSVWRIDAHQPLNIINTTEDIIFRTIVAVPISYKNKIQGMLNLLSQKVNRQTDDMQKFLEMTGILLGEYISHQLSQEKMLKMIDQDHLTGLSNRQRFEEILQKILEDNKTDFYPLIVLDIDKFKLVNEVLDYNSGDTILKIIVEKLNKYAERNCIARLAGNAFAIIPHTLENINQLTNYIYKILSDVKQTLEIEGKNISLTASIGVSIYPKDAKNAKQLLKYAEIAMEKAKIEGGDNFQLFTEELTKLKSDQLTLLTELKNAIIKNELSLYFQPKISVETGRIVAAESLIRWQHPIKGLLTPNIFLPIAEENNLVIPITEWIISECCNIINKYKLNIPIAINLSGEHFKENFNLIGYLNQILKGFHVNTNNIELEITETVFMSEIKQNLAVLVDLKRMGFKIAIDDFGTGFSSLSYLKNIAADYIKIDKSFIDNVPNNIDSVIITKAIIELSHSLDKKIIAEGVETLEQLQFLVNENCDQIQGYYFSKPLSINDLITLLKEDKKWDIPKKI
jgi:diguanylate cyclase (GGDEF)-like protein